MSLPFVEIRKPRESDRHHRYRRDIVVEEQRKEAVDESDQDPDDVLEEYYQNGEGEVDLQRAARQRLRRRPEMHGSHSEEEFDYLPSTAEIRIHNRRTRPHRPVGDYENSA